MDSPRSSSRDPSSATTPSLRSRPPDGTVPRVVTGLAPLRAPLFNLFICRNRGIERPYKRVRIKE
jgi:hypothetical protein